jgi:16S rRNA G1207 methylase RsmC
MSKKYKMNIYQGDFLSMDFNKFHKIIMNPPFAKSQDVKHILHAYSLLLEGGILVSVASSSIQWREGKLYDELKALDPEFLELPA